MKITYQMFIDSITGARLMDEYRPFLKMEATIWEQWKFDDDGVHYIKPEERGRDTTNLANNAFKAERAEIQRDLDIMEYWAKK